MDTLHGDVIDLGFDLAGDPRSIGHGAHDMVGDLSVHRGGNRHVHPRAGHAAIAEN